MSQGPPPGRRAGFASALPAYVLPLALIALLAASRIPYPLHGDQTLFMMGAETLQEGGVLYVDFWDAKQPGIFFFYWLAGRTFGFHAVGLHLFELLWHLALAAWMIRFLRPRLAHPVLASAAPVLAIGGYYAVAGNWELTQAEMLAALPLFACLAAASVNAAPGPTRLAWFASGVAAGAAALFKLLLAPIPAAIWLVLALGARRAPGVSWGGIVHDRWLPALLGTALVLGATAAAFASAGALEPLLWTSFAYPLQALATVSGPSAGRLLDTSRWLLAAFWPVVLFALLSPVLRGDRRSDVAFAAAAAWLAAGAAVFLAQTMSWWRYQTFLVSVPLAMLAAIGIDGLARLARERLRAAAPGAIALLVAALAFAPALRVRLAGGTLFPPRLETAADLIAWQRASSPGFDRVWADCAFLREPDARPGAIYVFGDPRAITLAGRRQAIAINGWSWESYPPGMWQTLPAALESAAPAYVAVEPMYVPLIREQAPAVLAWLDADYRIVKSGEDRVWYERAAYGGALSGD